MSYDKIINFIIMLVKKIFFHCQGKITQYMYLLLILWLVYKDNTYMKIRISTLMKRWSDWTVFLSNQSKINLHVMQPWVVYIINSFSSPTCMNVCMNNVSCFSMLSMLQNSPKRVHNLRELSKIFVDRSFFRSKCIIA